MTRSGRSSRAAPSDSLRSSSFTKQNLLSQHCDLLVRLGEFKRSNATKRRNGDIERGTPCAQRQKLLYTIVISLKNTMKVSEENDRIFVLLMTGQAHSEYRFRAVGPRFNVAAMGLGNLARDI
jgi:hypothetical protein